MLHRFCLFCCTKCHETHCFAAPVAARGSLSTFFSFWIWPLKIFETILLTRTALVQVEENYVTTTKFGGTSCFVGARCVFQWQTREKKKISKFSKLLRAGHGKENSKMLNAKSGSSHAGAKDSSFQLVRLNDQITALKRQLATEQHANEQSSSNLERCETVSIECNCWRGKIRVWW